MSHIDNAESTQLRKVAERLSSLPEDKQRLFVEWLTDQGIDAARLPIVVNKRPARVPLSFAQQRLWIIDQLQPGTPLYNMPSVLTLRGELDVAALEGAIGKLVERHEALRTTFAEEDGHPVQVVSPTAPVALAQVDLSELSEAERASRARDLANEEARLPFVLQQGPLLRAKLVRLSRREHRLLLTMHHIITDEWSNNILIAEFMELYDAIQSGRRPSLPSLPIQYADYALWQRRLSAGPTMEKQLSYWRTELGAEEYALALPADGKPPVIAGHRGADHWFELGGELTEALAALAKQHNATLFMTVLAGFSLFLSRYAGQKDVRVGVPVANRHRAEIEGVVGFFVNAQVLRTLVDSSRSFSEHIERVRQTVAGAQSNQDLPFERLVEALQPERRNDNSPLFDVLFSWHREADELSRAIRGLEVSWERPEQHVARFGLTLHVTETPRGLSCRFVYRTDLFRAQTIARMGETLRVLLADAVAKPTRPIGVLRWMDAAEQEQAVGRWSAGPFAGEEKGVHELIGRAAALRPGAVALRVEGRALSYGELERSANRLGNWLRARGIGREARVGVCLPRGASLIVGLYGVLKSGAAYVPMEPTLPEARLREMVEDSGARVVLGEESVRRALAGRDVEVVSPDAAEVAQGPEEALSAEVSPDEAAYVIYTSGSTGRPKGVVVTHRGVVSYVQALLERLSLPEAASMAMVSTVGADLGNTVLFGALCSGRPLHLLSEERVFDPDAMAAYMHEHGVDVLKIVPSHLKGLMHAARPERVLPRHTLVLGGEATPWELVEKIQQSGGCRIVNHYGPTETTVGVLTHEHRAERAAESVTLPLGRPLANSQVYVLSGDMQPVPVGVIGEIYIGGAGLARGYLNRAELTAERFVPNPYGSRGERLYRTGDRARTLEDGSIEFLGRADNQVKVRGYRVELGEVRAALLSASSAVADAHVLVREGQAGNARLVAYVIGKDGYRDSDALRAALEARLPEHMVPAEYVWLESFPLTANGKLDQRALPAPGNVETQVVLPRNELEEKLVQIWRELLKVERVGIHDSFFKLGGDSILALQAVSRARKVGIKLTPKQLFEHQTVAEAARVATPLVTARAAREGSGESAAGDVELTPIQRWFFEQEIPAPHHWNQSLLLEVRGDLDVALLESALQRLAVHHDALRLRYRREGGQWKQRYGTGAQPVFARRVDLSAETDVAAAIGRAVEAAQRSLDLAKGPLLRAVYMDLGGQPGRLLLTIHHLVVDGVSWRVLLEDLRTAYQQLKAGDEVVLPEKTSSFKQWSQAVARHARRETIGEELAYWQRVVQGTEPSLPAANPRGINSVGSARVVSVELDESDTHRLLSEATRAYRTQVNDLLLTALSHALCEWGRRDSVLIELEGHGREDLFEGIDVTRTVGWFTTLYPVRLTPESGDLGRSIKGIKEQLRSVPNKGFGYGVLRFLSAGGRTLAEGANPQVTFNYLGRFEHLFEGDALFRIAKEPAARPRDPESARRTWLAVEALIHDGQLRIDFVYSSAIHEDAHVKSLADLWLHHLQTILEHCATVQLGGATSSDFPLLRAPQAAIDSIGIDLRNVEDIYPMTPMQQGLMMHSLLSAGSGVYHMQNVYRVKRPLDPSAFVEAWSRVVQRHPILRTAFVLHEGIGSVQIVYGDVSAWSECLDWRTLGDEERAEALDRILEDELRLGFDLSKPQLFRMRLIHVSESEMYITSSYHHILVDAWCSSLVLRDFAACYQAIVEGREPKLPSVPRFRAYVEWLMRRDADEARAFWRQELEGLQYPTPLPFTTVSDEGELSNRQVGDCHVHLTEESTARILASSKRWGLTPNTLVQAAWALVLSRHSGLDDVVFGVTVAGRPADLDGVEAIVGLFIHSIPLRVRVDRRKDISSWIREVFQKNAQIRPFEYLPLTDIRLCSAVRGTSLFHSLLVFENAPIDAEAAEGAAAFALESVRSRTHTNYPVTIEVFPGSRFRIRLSYHREILGGEEAEALLRHLQGALEQLADGSDKRVEDISIASEVERKVLEGTNATRMEYPADRCLHELIEQQVRRTPEAIAASYEGELLSYAALNARANQVARRLRALGVGPGVLVGMFVERSLEMMIGLLGILKAGGGYVPLDPEYPAERLAYMVRDAQPTVLLTQERLLERAPSTQGVVWCLDRDWIEADGLGTGDLPSLTHPEDLAYCIYTSGSTGRPKGVVVCHRSVVNFLSTIRESPGLDASDRVLGLTSLSFDIAGLELYLPLLVGARVVLVGREAASDAEALLEHVGREGITVMQATPATWRMLSQSPGFGAMPRCKVLCGGEALPADLAGRLIQHAGRVWNLYGPTETTIWSSRHALDSDRPEPLLGRPIGNTTMFVLDERMSPAPVGVVGELYIGGDGLARGYLHHPELTAVRFVPNPFGGVAGERLYRTGDLVRYRPDGCIEYIGRCDHQVKIRGHRIELGEIEARLLEQDGVRAAVAVAREDAPGTKRLVAYVVPALAGLESETGEAPRRFREELHQALKAALPEYMVPSVYVLLAELPLTANGKVNRNALPLPRESQVQKDYVAPRSELEKRLLEIWSEVLGVERIGVRDSFFELGGHSLLVAQVVSRVRKQLDVELPLRALFEARTVVELAARVEQAQREGVKSRRPPLRPVGRDRRLPLSYAQQRLWFLWQLSPESAAYNIARVVRLRGDWKLDALTRTFSTLVARHEALRTRFEQEAGQGYQEVVDAGNVEVVVVDLRGVAESDRENRAREQAKEEIGRPFDLPAGSLLRVKVLRLADQEHVLVVTMHHIVSDAWSMNVLVEEFARLYRSVSEGVEPELPSLPIQVADYAVWQRAWLESGELRRQLAYWEAQLGTQHPMLELPSDRPRPAFQSHRGATCRFEVDPVLLRRLRDLAHAKQATLFVVLLAAFKVLLYRYSGQNEIRVGVPIANRAAVEVERVVGLFVNTQVLRSDVRWSMSFGEMLDAVRAAALEAQMNQDLPFEHLVEALNPQRSMSHNPLFQVMFNHQRARRTPLDTPAGLRIEDVDLGGGTTQFDLTLATEEDESGLHASLTYSTDLFDGATIDRMARHWMNLLGAIVSNPDARVGRLPLLDASERSDVLEMWNGARNEVPAEPRAMLAKGAADAELRPMSAQRCLHQLIEEQAGRTPAATAVSCDGDALTYAELNARANRLASKLRELGVGPDVLVGICVERSIEMVIGLLAILKAGGAYLPLDPDYPPERLAYMVSDARPRVVLTQAALLGRLPEGDSAVWCLDRDVREIEGYSGEDLETSTHPENLAYCIYTSGSTGRPKGALLSHHNVLRLFEVTEASFRFNASDVWTLFHSYAFDFSVWEIFGALLHGGKLVVVPYYTSRSADEFYQLLCREGVTVLNQTPSAFRQLMHVAELRGDAAPRPPLRYVVFGGEALEVGSLGPWFARFGDRSPQLVNMYGITETTVHVTYRPLTAQDARGASVSPIGRPIGDLTWYLLDAELKPVPAGVVGELYVGGAGLARGYLNRPELTAERFVPNPFCEAPGERLYRTGDLAKYRADGAVEYIGRIDHQVKIRGYRIELGEIEARLAEQSGVKRAVVLGREGDGGEKRLVAYVVPAQAGLSSAAAEEARGFRDRLRAALLAALPEYMVPAAYVLLDELPLTSNGKVDRAALPLPQGDQVQRSYVAPRSELERKLAEIWSEVLGVESAGIHDDFFELGGHSLLATQVISRVRSALEVELPLRALFEGRTLVEFAGRVEEAVALGAKGPRSTLVRVDRGQRQPLSYAQQRLWFLWQLEPESAAYNVPFAVKLVGGVNPEALADTFAALVERHEALRTTFGQEDGQGYQVIRDAARLAIPRVDLRGLPGAERERRARELAEEEASRPFDLERDELLRVTLLELSDSEHVLLVTMHHIVSDGWSMSILVKDFVTLYRAYSEGRSPALSSLPVQYVDYASWQRRRFESGELAGQLAYWKERLGTEHPVLSLPADHPRPSAQSYRGAKHSFELSTELSGRLRALAQERGATLFMVLLAAFKVLLHRYSAEEEIRVGVPNANRNHLEVEPLIGVFVNTHVLRTHLDAGLSFEDALERVKDAVLGAQAHQDVPFEKLVEALNPERSLSRTPLFQVMHNHERRSYEALGELDELRMEALELKGGTTQFDMSLDTAEEGDRLYASFTYSTDLFERGTIERMAEHWRVLLESITSVPEERIGRLPLLSDAERTALIRKGRATRDGAAARQERRAWTSYASLFEERVARHPDRVAAADGARALTFSELNIASNRVAHALIGEGVGLDDVVAILDDRSVDLLSMILGTLKAGAGYLPLDPRHPAQRVRQILESGRPRVVLATESFRLLLQEALSSASGDDLPKVMFLESMRRMALPEHDPGIYSGPANLAYVIYTSGSTGRPKGVMVEQRGMLNNQLSKVPYLDLGERDVIAQTASQCFDISVWQFLTGPLCGARVEIVPDDVAHDGVALFDYVTRRGITVLESVPGLIRSALSSGSLPSAARLPLRWLLPTGEALPVEVAEMWFDQYRGVPLVNAYGPAECSDDVALYTLRGAPEEKTPYVAVGFPVDGTELYIVDQHLDLVPAGVTGELCVAGVGVGRGYLQDAARTAESYVANPFSDTPGQRMYRTGDLARYRPDGVIEYVGRKDHQVKIRGYRVEPGEIEARLLQADEVEDAVVVLREDTPAEKRLVAYVVPKQPSLASPGTEDEARLREALRAQLKAAVPEYMVPSFFVLLERLPRTPNGKVDRKALPAPDLTHVQKPYIEARGEIEAALAAIWREALHIERVGLHDNFFELGGDSIVALMVVGKARNIGIRITPKDLFQHQTLEALAAVAGAMAPASVEQDHASGEVGLTPIQGWFFEQQLAEMHHWNQSVLLEIHGRFDVDLLKRALDQIVEHHDALRLRYRLEGGRWKQWYSESNQPETCWRVDLSGEPDVAAAITRTANEAQRSLHLEEGPLLRAVYMDLGAARPGRLLLVIHHMIVDGVSWRILLEDLQVVYEGLLSGVPARLPVKSSSFRRWSRVLEEHAERGGFDRELEYWRGVVGQAPAELPAMNPRGENLVALARTTTVELDAAETARLLTQAPHAYRTQVNDLLLTALAYTLCEWSAEESVLIELEGHGREDLFEGLDVTRTVGWFTSVYPVRLTPDRGGLDASIKSIKEQLRQVPNKGIGYGVLRYLSEKGSDLATGPEPRVSFNYLGQFDQVLGAGGMFRPASESTGTSRGGGNARDRWLEVNGMVAGGRLLLEWTFSAAIHDTRQIELLAERYIHWLQELIRHCVSEDAGGVTPSDFPEVALAQDELNSLFDD
ncbi:non-ribosomal peptide synthase/polyketide synthase [Sorangium sp. So ce426]|uniref:non-ribosomal peptide synthase/polyketide synthase n=1 Tax=Sorangium sp. So ce426 TaxID=3133312 RepID=UPI003F5BA4DD